jgi:hypothetical protein
MMIQSAHSTANWQALVSVGVAYARVGRAGRIKDAVHPQCIARQHLIVLREGGEPLFREVVTVGPPQLTHQRAISDLLGPDLLADEMGVGGKSEDLDWQHQLRLASDDGFVAAVGWDAEVGAARVRLGRAPQRDDAHVVLSQLGGHVHAHAGLVHHGLVEDVVVVHLQAGVARVCKLAHRIADILRQGTDTVSE